MNNYGEIILYLTEDGQTAIDVKFDKETIWLDAHQMASLFQRDRSVIVRHIKNTYKTGELQPESTCAKNAQVAKDGKIRQMDIYNLDVIISVGYRVNSIRGTQFRIWATKILKEHLIKGYTVNDKRLCEVRKAIKLVETVIDRQSVSKDETKALLAVVADYASALDVLDDFDHRRVEAKKGTEGKVRQLTYDEAISIISTIKNKFSESVHFGVEKDQSLKSSLSAVFQTFDGNEVYPSLEEKAANLLYFLVKNHSFVDGNKRIAAALFLWFMDKNNLLYEKNGIKRIADNTLVAVTLMTAESDPKDKDIICAIIANLINNNQ